MGADPAVRELASMLAGRTVAVPGMPLDVAGREPFGRRRGDAAAPGGTTRWVAWVIATSDGVACMPSHSP